MELIEKHQAPLLAQPFYAAGQPGPITRSLAHVPELLVATAPFLSAVYGDSAISKRLKEIVVLRTSALMQCTYCVQTHTAVALDAGLTRAEILALRGPEAAVEAFTIPRERTLVLWTDALAGTTGPLPGDLAATVATQFTDAEIVELTVIAGATLMLNRYCTALSLPTAAATLEQLRAESLL